MRRHAIPALIAAASLSLVSACSSSEPGPASESVSSAETSAAPSASSSTGAGADPTASPEVSGDTAAGDDVVSRPPSKSAKDALEAARKDFDGQVSKIELEAKRGGGLEYKIEQKSGTAERAVQLDADSLATLSEKTEDLGDDAAEELKETFDPDALISLEDAAKTAREQVPDGVITKWKIEGKDTGKAIYEFDIRPQGAAQDQEVQVDAKDGSIVKDS